jgi:hypothetical protein
VIYRPLLKTEKMMTRRRVWTRRSSPTMKRGDMADKDDQQEEHDRGGYRNSQEKEMGRKKGKVKKVGRHPYSSF